MFAHIGLYDDYPVADDVLDEMVADTAGTVRTPCSRLCKVFESMPLDELQQPADYMSNAYRNQGVTFDIGGDP